MYGGPEMNVPQLIEGLVERHGSVNAAARACGIPEGTMHKLARGERPNPTLDTLRALARGYDESLEQIASRLDGDGHGKGYGSH